MLVKNFENVPLTRIFHRLHHDRIHSTVQTRTGISKKETGIEAPVSVDTDQARTAIQADEDLSVPKHRKGISR